MTPLQRYRTLLAGGTPDFLPRLPILMQYAAERIGSNYGAFASDHRVLVEANLRCAEEFGIDQLNTMSDPYRETAAFGGPIVFPRDATPQCTCHPLGQGRCLAHLPDPDPGTSPRTRDRIDAIALYRRRSGDRFSVMGWVEGPAAEAADLRGVSEFLVDLVDDPDFCNHLMERCVDFALRFARRQIDAGADTIGIGDAIASQVSPRLYTRLILPHEQRLVAGLKEMGAVVRMHICGNITHILPGLATLDLDLLDIDHMVDLAQARRILGPRVALVGGIDPVAGVMRALPQEVADAALAAAQRSAGRYCVAGGCEIPPGTPAESLLALCRPVPVPAG
jgi:MtaA/CmuA family methyltransferase